MPIHPLLRPKVAQAPNWRQRREARLKRAMDGVNENLLKETEYPAADDSYKNPYYFKGTEPDYRTGSVSKIPSKVTPRTRKYVVSEADKTASIITASAGKMTDTPAFKAWFRGSKVVDGAGRPLRVFHSTVKDFDTFDTELAQMGSHFGTVEQATSLAESRGEGKSEYAPNIMACYLSIKNPLRLTDYGTFHGMDITDECKKLGIISETEAEWVESNQDLSAGSAFIKKAIIGKGYDGIVYLNRKEGLAADFVDDPEEEFLEDSKFRSFVPSAADSWIAFYPNQIKSAIGNNGEFDSGSNSITASAKSYEQVCQEALAALRELAKMATDGDVEACAAMSAADLEYFIKLEKGGSKTAEIDLHEAPKMLPPRYDARKGVDTDTQEMIDDGKAQTPVVPGVKQGARRRPVKEVDPPTKSYRDESGTLHDFCVICGADVDCHPDSSNPMDICGGCGGATCPDHRQSDIAALCDVCHKKLRK